MVRTKKMIALVLVTGVIGFTACEKDEVKTDNETNIDQSVEQFRTGEEVPEDVTFNSEISEEELIEILEPFEPHVIEEETYLAVIPVEATSNFIAGIDPVDPSGFPTNARVLATSKHFRAVLAMWRLYVHGGHDPCGGYYFTHGANGWSLNDGC